MSKHNKHGLNRHIPKEIKQSIAHHCGYGCVICAEIPYEYEHIDPEFKDAQQHDVSRMALLCAGCHTKVTKGLISKEQVKTARENPKCRELGCNKMGLMFNGSHLRFKVGHVQFNGPDMPIAIEGIPILSFRKGESDQLILNALFYDGSGEGSAIDLLLRPRAVGTVN